MWDRETKKWYVFPSPCALHHTTSIFLLSQNSIDDHKPTDISKHSGLVDFEMWDPYTGEKPEDKDLIKNLSAEEPLTELRKWGLAHKPPAKNWWAEFGIVTA
jgi:hypothetical protein